MAGQITLQSQAATRSPDPGARWSVILLVACAALLAARAAAAVSPGMWGWGLNVQRFVAPALGWAAWTLCALALIPSLGNAAARPLTSLGDALTGERRCDRIVWAACAAALIFVFPDRVQHLGDFLLRQGAARAGASPALYIPQEFPLDVALHLTVPHALMQGGWLEPALYERILGACEAGALAWLAASFARELGARGATAVAVTCVVFFGGHLALFTGYGKAFREIALLVAAAGLLALRAHRSRGAVLGLGVVVAVALGFHRLALGLIPLWILTCVLARRGRSEAAPVPSRTWSLAMAVPPLVAFAWIAPRVAMSAERFDRTLFGLGGPSLGSLWEPLRLLDLANMVLCLCPLAVVLPGLVVGNPLPHGDAPRGGERAAYQRRVLLTLAAPYAAVAIFLRPPQGIFRDWDDHAAVGVALSLLAAWVIATASRSTHAGRLAVVATLCVVVPTVELLAIQSDPERGVRRVESFLDEPPRRSADERALTRQYLGTIALIRDDAQEAAHRFRDAAGDVASPGILRSWAVAEALCGRLESSRAICRRLVQGSPGDTLGWRGLMATSYQLNDLDEARRAAGALLRLAPDDADARLVMDRTTDRPGAAAGPAYSR